VPDKRRHRGPHPADKQLFAEAMRPQLCRAVGDLSWLYSRGYAQRSSLKLVGDRFDLTQRQRMAVMRSTCGDEDLAIRKAKEIAAAELRDEVLVVDGYNVITTVETALGGAVVLVGRDGCFRDIAGVHGTYRRVEETFGAISLIGEYLARAAARQCVWYLDRPVSNSGRLKAYLLELAQQQQWNWQVEVIYHTDATLAESHNIVATSDSEILNRCQRWFNLAGQVVRHSVGEAFLVDLSAGRHSGGD